jgi:hypothetical protein
MSETYKNLDGMVTIAEMDKVFPFEPLTARLLYYLKRTKPFLYDYLVDNEITVLRLMDGGSFVRAVFPFPQPDESSPLEVDRTFGNIEATIRLNGLPDELPRSAELKTRLSKRIQELQRDDIILIDGRLGHRKFAAIPDVDRSIRAIVVNVEAYMVEFTLPDEGNRILFRADIHDLPASPEVFWFKEGPPELQYATHSLDESE